MQYPWKRAPNLSIKVLWVLKLFNNNLIDNYFGFPKRNPRPYRWESTHNLWNESISYVIYFDRYLIRLDCLIGKSLIYYTVPICNYLLSTESSTHIQCVLFSCALYGPNKIGLVHRRTFVASLLIKLMKILNTRCILQMTLSIHSKLELPST